MSLLYRAVPGSGLDPWLVSARRSLSRQLQEDLDLLHGFSGRVLYYMEEPAMAFNPLADVRIDATIEEFIDFLGGVPAGAFREMAIRAIDRAHRDLGSGQIAPADDDQIQWRRYIEPVLTTADADAVVDLLLDADVLKMRTVRLIRGVWESFYRDEFASMEDRMAEALRIARSVTIRGFGPAFAELTGNRLPSTLAASLTSITDVIFCPSAHVGGFVSYIVYGSSVVIFYAVQHVTTAPTDEDNEPVDEHVTFAGRGSLEPIEGEELLICLRALADANRLRILELLAVDELYAREIVDLLGIAQSAVSRHLSHLEQSHLVAVEPRRGMKYYALDREQITRVAEAIGEMAI